MRPVQPSGARLANRSGSVATRLVRVATCVAMLAGAIAGSMGGASALAAGQTVVSLTFDNNTISQYTLGYQQALQPRGAHATFFVNSGTIGGSGNFMSWAQVGALAAAGNDIGGKTVNATNLTTDPNPTAQVCNDRAALIQHGLTPIAFAYPGGAQNASVQAVVKGCGYGNGRTAGGLSATGATFAETVPPANWFATRAYAPGTVTLANLQSLVNGAASHGGGWDQIVIGKVCSQALDPNNYSTCSTASGHIELSDLTSFLDWVAAAGQAGGAPAGTTLDTVAHVVTGADPGAPTTTISCNGAACSGTPYTGVVSVTLAATDTGSGVSSTHYTTDGSDPTLSSPTYTGAFNVNGNNTSTTVNFRSWDYAGNAEATKSQVIQAPADSVPPTTTILCNGAGCSSSSYVNSVTVSFTVTDTGGSGVDKTYYTTDGSTPTTSSPVYSAPFQLTTGTTTVKFFSTDKAGNAETINAQQIQVVPVATDVTLAFDDGGISQYALGYQQALQPHGAPATFFVNSSIVGSAAKFISWSQLAEMQAAGNDIGSKTVHGTNLTTVDAQTATSEVCGDRTALIQHGLDPVAFAYPFGASNQSVKDIVKSCGFGNGRTAGSVSPNGPTYAETIPPKDWFATRAYAPTGQLSLANMKALVSGAAAHGGGWDQIVVQKVCSQAQDPSNYATCTTASSWIELADLNSFLDWMANAGQSGGAPAGATLATARTVLIGADSSAPATTISCDGAVCPSGTVPTVVHVTFSATDVGSGVASTHYTTDGSDPTLSSPTYSKPVPITSPTTVKFRSWDHAGNAESVQSQFIQATPPPDNTPPTTTISCNGSACTTAGYNGQVAITMSVDDGTGWGPDSTYYTTDGSTPTTSSPVYAGPFQLNPGTYIVQFFSTDLAGNAEQVQSQQIQVLPPQTIVSLTFDDGSASQYIALQHALEPHHVNGTFYIISSHPGNDTGSMTWSQLTAVNLAGNEIGGHTRDHINMVTTTDYQTKVTEVCGGRQDLIDHGFYPTSFAYPEGAYDATAEGIVQSCGFTSGRASGGVDVAGEGAGPVYAETIPPKDAFATRTVYNPNGAQLSLAHLETAVTSAWQHGGGWIQIVFHQVCSQTYDPANYSFCISSSDFGPVELSTMNSFLDWLQNSGQPGGAPARTTIKTVSQVIDGPDTQSPTTQLMCDGTPCQQSTYHGSVTMTLSATDPGGSGVQATYYTTDGSAPTTSSPVYTEPFMEHLATTIRFFSVDNAGNAEQSQSQLVDVAPNADPVIGAAGDIACDPASPAFNNGDGTSTDCLAKSTGNLLSGADVVLPLGDNQYNCGGTSAYQQSYDHSWGRFKPITHPVPGDKDYATSGGTDCPATPGAGYYQYFGSSAGDPSKGYYSYNLGSWHLIALNTAPCGGNASTCAAGSAQDLWLKQDLSASGAQCTLAYYQNPRFASNGGGGDPTYQQIWQDLYDGGVDVVLNGDSHWYERFQPMNATGAADAANGIREFIVGTGGQGLDNPGTQLPTSQVLNNTTHGVIKLTLHAGSYDWTFLHASDGTLTDSGTTNCHQVAPPGPAVTSFAPTSGPEGTSVTIAGTSFTGATAAKFNGVAATAFTVNSSTMITATVPSGATTGTISVTTPNGTGTSSGSFSVTPDVTSFSPTSGLTGTSVTITGTTFSGATAVKFNNANATFTVDSDTQITATVPSNATTGPISVTTPSGTATSSGSFSVTADTTPPTTTIACNNQPCSGTYGAPVAVTLSATDTGGSGVDRTLYTTDGTDPATSLTAVTYQGAFTVSQTTTVKFLSIDKAGDSEAVQSQLISFIPSVTSFAPTSGPVGTSVTITGTSFTGATAVKFNNTNATFTVNSSTTITATVPSGATNGTISVTTPSGTGTSSDSFSVTPSVTSFSPTSGPVGTSVTIAGTSFTGATAAKFNGVAATAFTVNSSTMITATVPPGATTGRISVTTPSGTGTSSDSFSVTPGVTNFTPNKGAVGTSVTITGTSFTGATAVKFNGVAATTFTVNSATKITATVPSGATTGKISVTTPSGTGTSSGSFSVTPGVTSFSPTGGSVGTSVTITGTTFTGATAVKFNNNNATFTVDSDTQITATVPSNATTGPISVTTPSGTGTSSGSFTVAPDISNFTPKKGPVGTSVTITGTSFTGATAVKFNGVAATTFTVNSATKITATVPSGATTGKISVTTPSGTGTSSGSFTVT